MVSRESCQQPEVVISGKDSALGSFHPISRGRYGNKERGFPRGKWNMAINRVEKTHEQIWDFNHQISLEGEGARKDRHDGKNEADLV